jgi:hypothetical protein
MPNKVRINLANPAELLELPGVSPQQVEAILKFRAEHGPISDERELAGILGSAPEALSEQADFSPSDTTAPEAPGAKPPRRAQPLLTPIGLAGRINARAVSSDGRAPAF